MSAFVLVINCGSSSLKFALIDNHDGNRLLSGLAERLGSPEAQVKWSVRRTSGRQSLPDADHAAAMEYILMLLKEQQLLQQPLVAVGHRVVHGGERFTVSTLIDESVMDAIEACIPLAPLHNPANILGIKTAKRFFPDTPQVAVFDTAFHQSLPAEAYLYPVPYTLYVKHGVRRYGFHGTSHRFVTQRAAILLDRPLDKLALISAHLGNGCSAAAVLNGRSIDTTMGLTPLEGLVMGTRSGDVDPSLHQYLHAQLGYDVERTTAMLNKESGLLGLSELSNDMRTLEEEAAAGHEQAQLAIDVFCYRLAKTLAGYAAALGRLDALIFTGGIGEHSSLVREKVLARLEILGLTIDPVANDDHGQQTNGRVSTSTSPAALVIPTDEERMIALDSAALVENL